MNLERKLMFNERNLDVEINGINPTYQRYSLGIKLSEQEDRYLIYLSRGHNNFKDNDSLEEDIKLLKKLFRDMFPKDIILNYELIDNRVKQ